MFIVFCDCLLDERLSCMDYLLRCQKLYICVGKNGNSILSFGKKSALFWRNRKIIVSLYVRL